MKRIISILLIFVMAFSISLFPLAHSGRTDARGGHKDNKNVSGLGSYHYHCGGNPPHLHTNGVCPYASTSASSNRSSSSSSSSSTASYEENLVYFNDISEESSSESSGSTSIDDNTTDSTKKIATEIKEYFQKHFTNEMYVVYIGHLGEFNASLRVIYKSELSGLNTQSLVFYNYNQKDNIYSKIESPDYTFKDGALEFTTESNQGYVIITDKDFVKK
ncbi:YHYH domain-containing protein [Oscillospiraceae bacterium MB08-C2-2]|nr:YHYH domain-containing protein [Oscillospiraceae bacterium MB08-C2-2]